MQTVQHLQHRTYIGHVGQTCLGLKIHRRVIEEGRSCMLMPERLLSGKQQLAQRSYCKQAKMGTHPSSRPADARRSSPIQLDRLCGNPVLLTLMRSARIEVFKSERCITLSYSGCLSVWGANIAPGGLSNPAATW